MPSWPRLCQWVQLVAGYAALDVTDDAEQAHYEAWLATLAPEERPLDD